MSEWVDVIDASAMANGENVVVDVDGTDVAVFKIDGDFYAIEDVCTHDGAEIASGELDGDEIICPRHGARFDIVTGRALSLPAVVPIPVYDLLIVGDEIRVSRQPK